MYQHYVMLDATRCMVLDVVLLAVGTSCCQGMQLHRCHSFNQRWFSSVPLGSATCLVIVGFLAGNNTVVQGHLLQAHVSAC